MFNKLNDLRFIIGLFFLIVALILLISALISDAMSGRLNVYTGVVFLVFGLLMMFVKGRKNVEQGTRNKELRTLK